MSTKCQHKNPLQRDGTSQHGRPLAALDPASVQLDDRSADDLLHYAHQLSAELNFYGLDNQVAGDWQNFLAEVATLPESEWERRAGHQPHVALLLAFLKTYRQAQGHLNFLPQQHLEFFYKKILRLLQKPPVPDYVNVIFELNKKIEEQKVPKGALLDAGKDSLGKPLRYALENDLNVNRAQVAQLRSVFNDGGTLRHALFANTKDGWGEALDPPDLPWSMFGHGNLPKAETGIALASHLLLLTQGERQVTLTFSISGGRNPLQGWDEAVFLQNLRITASGEKAWLGPFGQVERAGAQPVLAAMENGYRLRFQFLIPQSEAAVVPYDGKVLQEHFNTASPVVRLHLSPQAQKLLTGMRLDSVQIAVQVDGLTDLAVENDFGPQDASKPFQPFGPQPKTGSSFYVGSEEVFTKNFTDLKLKVKWQGLPSQGFAKLYENYPTTKKVNDFTAKLSVRGSGRWGPPGDAVRLFPDNGNEATIPPSAKIFAAGSLVLAKPVQFRQVDLRAVRYAPQTRTMTRAMPRSLMLRAPFIHLPLAFVRLEKKLFSPVLQEGFLKLVLQQNFGHNEFFQHSAYVAANNAKTGSAREAGWTWKTPPSPPYTPVIESLQLSYSAETDVQSLHATALDTEAARANAEQKFNEREVQFFHLAPFGHREEHGYIKRHLPFLPSSDVALLPEFPKAGEFYLGLSGAEPLRQVHVLFQLAEGSADPELPDQAVEWSILSRNHWMPLGKEQLLADHTDGLLRSGIISFAIPAEASADNTLLDSGLHWLRATVPSHPAAVCKAIGLFAQAARAVWLNRGNATDHLATALPANSVKKLVAELGPIKKVLQPYASFGGREQEQPAQFYVRVSERLRHKNRAVGLWDYERLVLEEFPSVHKVKCLNHTGRTREFAPGKVTLVLIPQLRNQNAVDILQPKFSSAMLRDVEVFLQKHCSKFVEVFAENPDYEEVAVSTRAKFRTGFETKSMLVQLADDLVQFLSPWAFKQGQDIHFGGSVHTSRLIAFAEQLPYVDFVEHFSLTHDGQPAQHTVVPSSSKSILVSAKKHSIESL